MQAYVSSMPFLIFITLENYNIVHIHVTYTYTYNMRHISLLLLLDNLGALRLSATSPLIFLSVLLCVYVCV